jgi:hypothetical protein
MSYFLLRYFTILVKKAKAKITKNIFFHVPVELDQPILRTQIRNGELWQDRRRTIVVRTVGFILNLCVWWGPGQGGGRIRHPVTTRTTGCLSGAGSITGGLLF